MSETLLFSAGIVIIIVGVRFLNKDTGGTVGGLVLILAGLGAIVRACGYGWTSTIQVFRW